MPARLRASFSVGVFGLACLVATSWPLISVVVVQLAVSNAPTTGSMVTINFGKTRIDQLLSGNHNRWNTARAFGETRAVLHLAGKLTACGVDVVAARLAHRRHERRVGKDARKRLHALGRRRAQSRLRKRIKRNQVEL